MEENIVEQVDIGTIIVDVINSLCQNLFSSIDNAIFPIIDKLVFIKEDIAENTFLERILGTNTNTGLLVLANALLVAFVLYYSIRRFTAFYIGTEVESPYVFFIRSIFVGILMNFSLIICSGLVSFTSQITEFICFLGENIFKQTISFSNLIEIMSTSPTGNFNTFSLDGILTGATSISSFSLIISFALRYIMIKVLILLSPFAFLCLLNNSTFGFFKSWYKSFLSLLILQIIITLILLLPYAIIREDFNSTFSKLLMLGAIIALLQANQFVKEFMGGIGIGTNFQSGVSAIKSMILR